ncbi:hypothetical protein [Candidatus Nanopusillus massiliensis]|uniref:hypothetical protein n=1 Tax=Candidatus Nanopusillus massiliensis TaxID=2897163 RepID=UPI001E47C9E9|nr:hypothetical protein [Candidatus Nanopusillus massiliensis]
MWVFYILCTVTVIVVEFVTPFCAVPEIVTEYVPGVIDDDDAVTVKFTDAFGVTVVLDNEHCRFELLVEQERVTGKAVFPVN